MSDALLQTKLYIPPLRPNLVPRPRLIERLNQGLNLAHKLTLISAPAGFGKTTLVSEWLAGRQRPAAWLSLDEGDNDPIRFLIYFVAALQTLVVLQKILSSSNLRRFIKKSRIKAICMENPFKWRHFQSEIILLTVRWYLRYPLSYRDLEEMMSERGLSLDHTTIYRWVQHYAPEIDKRSRPFLKQTNDSWRVDETYVKVRGQWMYLYRAVDSTGQTLDFLLNQTRSTRAAKRFFRKVLGRPNIIPPRVINVDKNGCYIGAVRDLKREKLFPEKCKRRPSQYMNNIIEQDHRFIKRKIKPGLGFFSYPTAWRTIRGYEVMHMIRKGQIEGAEKGNIQAQNQFVAGLFGLAT